MYDIVADISAGSRLTSNIKMLYGTQSKIYCYSYASIYCGYTIKRFDQHGKGYKL